MEIFVLIIQVLILLSIVALFFLFKNFLLSYFKKKGENLATKEDISEITSKIEDIKKQYASELEQLKSSLQLSNQLIMGAFDKRIEKYQEAFSLWLQLYWSLDNPDLNEKITNCQNWWNNNCLYLDENSRQAFKTAFLIAGPFRTFSGKARIENWDKIEKVGQDILKAINLPAITKEELKKAETSVKTDD